MDEEQRMMMEQGWLIGSLMTNPKYMRLSEQHQLSVMNVVINGTTNNRDKDRFARRFLNRLFRDQVS